MALAQVVRQWLKRVMRLGVPLYEASKLSGIAFIQHERGIHAYEPERSGDGDAYQLVAAAR